MKRYVWVEQTLWFSIGGLSGLALAGLAGANTGTQIIAVILGEAIAVLGFRWVARNK